ncbi:MAG TPA: hypothetical protein VE309_05165 [Caulobacteraceae bacterium]|nr:hypothetical protein [Caulobacteraceae bacterium]
MDRSSLRAALAGFLLIFAGAVFGQAPTSPPPPTAFTLVDARPARERTTYSLSESIWSCDFGVYQLGDDLAFERPASPRLDRIAGLKADLARGLGARLAGRTLTVDHYDLYLNLTASQSGVAPNEPLGALAPKGQTREAKCPRDKMTAGWFDGAELSTPYPPYIIEMDVELDGEHYAVRTVVSTQKDISQLDIIQAAFAQADMALIADLAKTLP